MGATCSKTKFLRSEDVRDLGAGRVHYGVALLFPAR
jgi:hypothetical protein